MRRRILVLLAAGLAGCAYYNALYNANVAFDEAEVARREGRESFARAKYAEAIDRAAKSYRSSEEGRWADDALYLIGRSHARRGDWPQAEAALEAALARTDSEELAAGARVFLGAAAVSVGDERRGMALLDSALINVADRDTRSEAFLWRARARYGRGPLAPVWIDLDSAEAGGDRYRVEASMDRLAWAVETGELDHASHATSLLFRSRRAAPAVDTIRGLIRASSRRWGAAPTLPSLAGAETATWPPANREKLVLLRAEVEAEAGDWASAMDDAEAVSRGVGPEADRARVLLARWRMADMHELDELDDIRSLLLPAVGSTEARLLLEQIKTVGLLVERSGRGGQGLALFAAAELARDELGSPGLAATLFQAYADVARGGAWEGKALLGALALTDDPDERTRLLARIDSIPDNPYVSASRWQLGDRQPEFAVVERRLEGTLATIQAQVAAEAQTRDVLVGAAARSLDSLRASEAIARRLAAGDSTVLDSLRADSLRIDSIRMDSIRRDSVRGLDSLFADTLLFDTARRDTVGPGTPPSGPSTGPRPVLLLLRDGAWVPASPAPEPREGTSGVEERQ